jgi:hypothetical protein
MSSMARDFRPVQPSQTWTLSRAAREIDTLVSRLSTARLEALLRGEAGVVGGRRRLAD